MAAGFELLTAFVEVEADAKEALSKVGEQFSSSPEGEKAGSGFGKKLVGGIGVALAAAGLGKLLGDAMDIQAGNAKLAAGLDLTKSQSAAAGKAAGSLYSSNYGDSMEDVQDAVGAVMGSIDGMKGANSSAVSAMTKDLLNLRTAYGIDVADSAAAAGELLKTGMAKNGKEAADLLSSGLSRVAPALRQDLLDAANEYQPYFQQIGFSGSQMFDTLVAASKGGAIQLDKAGDAVKEFGIRVTDTTDANAGPALKRLGLDQKQLADDMLAGGDKGKAAMSKIVSGLQAVKDPSEQARLTAALFGTQIEDIGKGKIPGFLAGMNSAADSTTKVAGSADKLDKTLNNTASATLASVQRGFQGWTNDLIQNSGVLGGLVGVAGTVGPTLITSGAGVATMAGALSKMGIVTKIAAAGQWLLNAAMSANPIGIVVLAIAALVAALVWFFTQTTLGKTILAGFFSWLQAVVGAVATWWSGVWKGISAVAAAVWAGIVFLVTAYVNAIRAEITFVLTVIRVAWQTAWNLVSTVARAVWSGIVGFVTGYVNTVHNVIRIAILAAQLVWSGTLNTIRSVASSVWGAIVGFVTGYVNTVRSVITGGIRMAESVWSAVLGTIRSVTTGIFSGITGTVRGAVGSILDVVGGIPGKIRGFFSGAGSWLLGVGRAIIEGLASGIRNAVGLATGAIGHVLDTVKSFLPHSPAKRGPFSGSGWTAVGDSGESIVGEVATGFNRAARRTNLAMPSLTTKGAFGARVAGQAPLRTVAGGTGGATSTVTSGDTIHATLQVDMSEVDDVSKLVSLFKALPQAARTGRSTVVGG